MAGSRKGSCLASDAPRVTDARSAARAAADLLESGRIDAPLLVVSDLDGTVAELVSDPWAAAILPAARRALRRLAVTPGVSVALLSGRGVLDLAKRARVGGVRYLGDHGAEWADARRGFRPTALHAIREPATAAELAMAVRLGAAVPDMVPEPWLVVEAKGPAVTFHFRAAPDVDEARSRVLAAARATDPAGLLVRAGGRRSLELRPAAATDKGVALRRLIEEREPGVVVMLGDDPSDALAFATLREGRAAGRIDGLAIAVAGRPDVSAEVAPQADLLLASPRQAARFLTLLGAVAERRHVGADAAPTNRRPRAAPGPRRRPRSSRARPR